MPNKELLIQYANLKIKQKAIEDELELLKELALQEIKAIQGGNDQPVALQGLEGFSFSLQKRKTWTYSQTVNDLKGHFEDQKKLEEQTGMATYVEKEILVFNQPKE